MQDRSIYTTDDVLLMLDALLEDSDADWNECFADRSRPCPFFVEWPDENLVAWFGQGQLTPGRVLELGCGHGRNATYLAGLGCGVDAVDLALLPTLIGLVVNLVIARSRRAAGAPALAWSPATAAPATRRRG